MCGWEMRFEERDGEFGAVTFSLALIFFGETRVGVTSVWPFCRLGSAVLATWWMCGEAQLMMAMRRWTFGDVIFWVFGDVVRASRPEVLRRTGRDG